MDSYCISDACVPCHNRMLGDVCGDGIAEVGDASAMAAVLLDPGSATPEDCCAADVNSSGLADCLDIKSFVKMQLGV